MIPWGSWLPYHQMQPLFTMFCSCFELSFSKKSFFHVKHMVLHMIFLEFKYPRLPHSWNNSNIMLHCYFLIRLKLTVNKTGSLQNSCFNLKLKGSYNPWVLFRPWTWLMLQLENTHSIYPGLESDPGLDSRYNLKGPYLTFWSHIGRQ